MYEDYHIRPALLKSKQYYNNAFGTAVKFEDLMALKKELIVEHRLPSGLGISLGPSGEDQALMGLALQEAQR